MNAALRPLVAMERASRRIAAGALSLRLEEPPTHDEIGRLARAFNSMVAQLEAAFARQKQFVGDVSHELRTPLTALGGGLEMLLMGADRGDPTATRRLLRSQYAEVERMRRLVEDLLTLARLDEGHTVLRPETLDVAPLLNDIVDEAERLTTGQTLRRDIAPDLPLVSADRDRLRQVLLVLLDNAVKYTPGPGTITLAARRASNGGLRLDVRDTGMGIPSGDLPHVFERFYRVDPARERTEARSGSGLGLAIAKSLVEAQGGAIAIESTPGSGTTVMITFPPAPAAVTPPLAPSEQPSDAPSPAAAGQSAPARGT
jgi:two-component system OmpR family sensor kinase